MTVQIPLQAGEGEACHSCAAPLARDQRYCLECGARRGEMRVPLAATARGDAPSRAEPESLAPAGRDPQTWSNVAALATVGCLLLAMGVGVLIGRSATDGRASRTPAPAPVIKVQQSGAAPVAATATPAASATPSAADAKRAAAKRSARRSSSSSARGKSDSQAVQDLQKLPPAEYQKKAAKLPKTLGTGGRAPPKDKKAPAAGGDFQDIG